MLLDRKLILFIRRGGGGERERERETERGRQRERERETERQRALIEFYNFTSILLLSTHIYNLFGDVPDHA